jgi:general secretion pathway protein G
VTLLELMLVLAILTILVAIAVPSYSSYREKADTDRAIADIRHIELSLTEFWYEWKCFPANLAAVAQQGVLDPWGNPYQYHQIQCNPGNPVAGARKDKNLVPINSTYDLYSMGPDGISQAPLTAQASLDDIVRANDGRYVGLAANY